MFKSFALCLLTAVVVLASEPQCKWVYQTGARVGEQFSGTLTPSWPDGTCDAAYMSYTVIDPVPGFAFDSIRSPNFKYTPTAEDSGKFIRVNLKITCRIFTNVCDMAAVFFLVAAAATTTTTTTTTTTITSTTPTSTTTTSTTVSALTSAATASSTTTSMASAVTTANVTTVTPSPTIAPTNLNTSTATTVTNTTTTTTTPMATLAFMGICPIRSIVSNATVSTPLSIDLGFTAADVSKNALGITSCSQQLTPALLLDSATVNGNTASPNVAPRGLWSTGGLGNTNIVFDSVGANTVEGIFSVTFNVLCGSAPLCNSTVSVVISSNLTVPPISTVPSCERVYGYTGYYGFGTNYSVTGIDGETQCPDSTPLRTVTAITTPQANPSNFSFYATAGKFFYLAPKVSTTDSFILGVKCNGQLYCQATVHIITDGATPFTPTAEVATTSTPVATLETCPDVYQFPISVPVPASVATFSLNGRTNARQCSGSTYYRKTSEPTNGGSVLIFDSATGAVTYLTPNSLAVTLDHFEITAGCSGTDAWECKATAYILITEGTPAPTTAVPTAPQSIHYISDQLTCAGTCDADDVLKVAEGLPTIFDINNTLGPSAGWARGDKKQIGLASYEVTRYGTLNIKVFGKVGNLMSGRFPTFVPIVPDRYFTAGSVVAGDEAAVAFNASCLSRQTKYGIAEELWKWTNISRYEGKTVGNYASSDNIYQKFGGKHFSCDTFHADSCKYAPTLTPATAKNVFTGEYNLTLAKPATPPNVDWSSYIRWELFVNGCDATWQAELTPRQIRSLATIRNGTKSKLFNRISDRALTGNLYSQSVKPTRWHPPFNGVDVTTSANPIAISIGNSLVVDTTQTGYDSSITARIVTRLVDAGATTTPTTTTTTTTATTAATTSTTSMDGNATSENPNITLIPTTTMLSTTTGSTTPTATAATPTYSGLFLTPNVTISTDVQFFSGTNANAERTYGYNIILFPSAASTIDFGNLFVADVSIQSADFSTPATANCPRCTGTNATCEATGASKTLFDPTNSIFDSKCVNASGGTDVSLVSLVAGPTATGVCAGINATSPAAKLAPLVTGVSASSTCPQTYFNITIRGTVHGAQSSADVGQPEAVIIIKVTLSNGQVFQTTLQQLVFLSQVATSPADLLATTSCRSSTYYPVKDPFGHSSPTARLVFTTLVESSISGTAHHTATCPDTTALTAAATTANNGAAANATLVLTNSDDKMCASESTVLSPTDWHFFQIETNDTLDYLTLSVAAAEVVPSPQVQSYSFILAHSANPTLPASLNNVLPWKRYAAMISFRQFATTVNPATNTKILSFAFIPGTLLRPGSSSQVPFTLEASLITPEGLPVYLRTVLQVSAQMVRKESGRDLFDLGTYASFGGSDEETSHTALILAFILCGGGVVVILIAVYFDDTAKGIVLDQHAMVMELVTGKKSERPQKKGAQPQPSTSQKDPFASSPNTIPTRFVDGSARSVGPRQPRLPVHDEPPRVRHFDLEIESEPKRRHDSEERETYNT